LAFSRFPAKEIRDNLPEMIDAARLLSRACTIDQANPGLQFIVPLAPTLTAAQRGAVAAMVERLQEKLTIRLVDDVGAEDGMV